MENLSAVVRSILKRPATEADEWVSGSSNSRAALALAAIAGVGVGILIGLLVAPCAGRELRQALRTKLGQFELPRWDDQETIDIELERMTGEGGIG